MKSESALGRLTKDLSIRKRQLEHFGPDNKNSIGGFSCL